MPRRVGKAHESIAILEIAKPKYEGVRESNVEAARAGLFALEPERPCDAAEFVEVEGHSVNVQRSQPAGPSLCAALSTTRPDSGCHSSAMAFHVRATRRDHVPTH